MYWPVFRSDCFFCASLKMARPEGFEPPTPWFVARYSIQLSYGRVYWRRERDSNPRWDFSHTPLAGERLRPLGHLSSQWSGSISVILMASTVFGANKNDFFSEHFQILANTAIFYKLKFGGIQVLLNFYLMVSISDLWTSRMKT
ncbi:hypothetical protein Lspi_1441 [Legionella spiritensis]|uniref:Uncharacterized protein n=1 Tax=Legionella spiritensis TaxID=452 RepID=A0A0W0Z480_LEGSP|nr:hypothetical protein Lspi_1441 [Legionella spiritensis]